MSKIGTFFYSFTYFSCIYDTMITGDFMSRIFIIEDDLCICESLKEALERKNYDVIVTYNVKQT